jgi:cell division protein FtsB
LPGKRREDASTMHRTLFGKLLIAVALLVFGYLQYNLWVGEGGINDVRKLKQTIAAQQTENATLAERNRVLEAEVKDLKTGMEAIEEHSRQDLGMIKNNETFYLVTGNPKAKAAPPAASAPVK